MYTDGCLCTNILRAVVAARLTIARETSEGIVYSRCEQSQELRCR